MPSAGNKGFLRAEVLDFHAKFLTSTLSSLADLFDDEKAPEVLPMFVRVENTTVVIKVYLCHMSSIRHVMRFMGLFPNYR